MISAKRLEELEGEKLLIHTMDANLYDTLEAALRVVEAAKERHYDDADGLYVDTHVNCLACKRLSEALAPFAEEKEKE